MSFVIVPDYVDDAIRRALNAAIKECPDARNEYEQLYGKLLDYYNEHGCLPDFVITKSG